MIIGMAGLGTFRPIQAASRERAGVGQLARLSVEQVLSREETLKYTVSAQESAGQHFQGLNGAAKVAQNVHGQHGL